MQQQYEFEKTNEPYFLTDLDVILQKLKLADIKDGNHIIDLGCGDARALIAACQMKEVTGTGYEILPEALKSSAANIQKNGLEDRIKIIEQNYLEADISTADLIILYLSRTSLGTLSRKLENELKPGAKIVTHDFDIPAWESIQETSMLNSRGQTTELFLYQK